MYILVEILDNTILLLRVCNCNRCLFRQDTETYAENVNARWTTGMYFFPVVDVASEAPDTLIRHAAAAVIVAYNSPASHSDRELPSFCLRYRFSLTESHTVPSSSSYYCIIMHAF